MTSEAQQPIGHGQASLTRLIEAPAFRSTIMAVIIINAIVIGMETDARLVARVGGLLLALDRIAIAIFTVEIALKLVAYRARFFRDGWNVFDFIIVAAAYVPASAGLSILRALRIVRALRLISVVPRMRQVVQGLLTAIPSMGTVILLLVLIFYVAAVITTKLFGEAFPQWFGSLGASLYSLFQIMTLESWSMGIVRPLMEVFPLAWVFFVPFVLVTSFVVLNLFIAIIVNAMHEAEDEASHDERGAILSELRALRAEVAELRASFRPNQPGT